MRKYTKPSVEVIELQIAENIAALVPKTIYKSSKSGSSGLVPEESVVFADKDTFGNTSII